MLGSEASLTDMVISSDELMNTPITPTLNETQSPDEYFNETFFQEVWPVLIGTGEAVDMSATSTPNERTKLLWESIKPSLDEYITATEIPINKLPNESDVDFFKRLSTSMYEMNQRVEGTWEDCFPSTAKEIQRLNCALGSLVVARALEKAGFSEDEIEYGYPGPMSHAVIFARGQYIDQANGVVIPVVEQIGVNGLKAYRIDIDKNDDETLFKVPFRLVPVCRVDQGTPPLVWNLGSMAERVNDGRDTEGVGKRLMDKFGLDPEMPYGAWARRNLLPEKWQPERMDKQPEWTNEKKESSARINS